MEKSATFTKSAIILSRDAIREIERILSSDETAKVTPTKDGITVYREKLKKAYTQS